MAVEVTCSNFIDINELNGFGKTIKLSASDKWCLATVVIATAHMLGVPQPRELFGVAKLDAVFLNVSITLKALKLGCACQKQVMAPAKIGQEKEVPLAWKQVPVVPLTHALPPRATRSGLILPSAVGLNYQLHQQYKCYQHLQEYQFLATHFHYRCRQNLKPVSLYVRLN